jgi:hypothetical protein
MSSALGSRAKVAVQHSQLLGKSVPGLVRQCGPVRCVSAVPGQKPGSDQYGCSEAEDNVNSMF